MKTIQTKGAVWWLCDVVVVVCIVKQPPLLLTYTWNHLYSRGNVWQFYVMSSHVCRLFSPTFWLDGSKHPVLSTSKSDLSVMQSVLAGALTLYCPVTRLLSWLLSACSAWVLLLLPEKQQVASVLSSKHCHLNQIRTTLDVACWCMRQIQCWGFHHFQVGSGGLISSGK